MMWLKLKCRWLCHLVWFGSIADLIIWAKMADECLSAFFCNKCTWRISASANWHCRLLSLQWKSFQMVSEAARIDACGCFSWRISGVWRYIVSASSVSVTAVYRLAINFSVKLQSGAYVLDGIYNTWHLHAPYCLLNSVSIHYHYIPFTDLFSCSFNEWHVSKTRSFALKM